MHKHCCNRPSKYSPVTHVIFDLDGTLIDSEHVYEEAFKNAVESFGVAYEKGFILKVQGRVQYDGSKIAVEHFNLPCTIEEFTELFAANSAKFLDDLDLMPGVERLINHLHKFDVPICIATSSAQDSFDIKTKKFPDLFGKFHHVVCGGSDPDVANGKPAPDIFLVAASRFEEPVPEPKNCLVFEDSVNGMQAGIAAGMQVVIIPEPLITYEDWKQATMRLDSLNYIMPELFHLPPFPDKEIAKEFVGTRVIKYGDSSFILPMAEKLQQDAASIKTDEDEELIKTEEEQVAIIKIDEDEGSIKTDEEQKVKLPKDDSASVKSTPSTKTEEAIKLELPDQKPSTEESFKVEDEAEENIDFGLPAAESSRNDLDETEDENFVTAIEGDETKTD